MTRTQLHQLYKERSRTFSANLEKVRTEINLISNLRIVVAVLFIGSALIAIRNEATVGILSLICIVTFFVLVKKHALLFDQKVHLENLVKVNDAEENILRGEFKGLHAGHEFLNPQHAYSHDLDLFGPGSLFQYLNRCNTIEGRKTFAGHLTTPPTDKDFITQQQESIRDVTDRIEFRQHFQAAGMESGEQPDDHKQLLQWAKQPSLIKTNTLWKVVLILVPLATLAAIVAAFFNSDFRVLVTGLIFTQWTLTGLKLKKINAFHDYVSRKKNILKRYAKLLAYIEKESFQSTRLKKIASQAHEADVNIRKLASLVNALDARTNVLATFFVNSVLLYDLQCVFRLEKWKEDHANKLSHWLNAITDMETIVSFGAYGFNNPGFTYAVIQDKLSIVATDLSHPLIDEKERVPSSLTMHTAPCIFIITGANMAGKSTFLRTVGVNIVLGLNGAPVCATHFECPIIELRTGMRTADSLQDHQSYFYAELNRLKSIMDELRRGRPLLILLDEILKGTNSTDKQAGSMSLVKQLLPHPCLAMIATHDLALGDLQQEYPQAIENFCFEANIENDQLFFDYKLKPGLATKMNASFLMKKMGIIP